MKDFNLIIDAAIACKTGNKNPEKIKAIFCVIEKVFDAINSAPEGQKTISFNGDYFDIDEIEVPEELKALILPKSVKVFAGDDRCKDVLIRDKAVKLNISKHELNNAYKSLRTEFNKDPGTNFVRVGDISKHVTLFDALSICSVDQFCHGGEAIYWPIPIDGSKVVDLFEDSSDWFNRDVMRMKVAFADKLRF